MSKQAREAQRQARRAQVEAARARDAAARTEADHPWVRLSNAGTPLAQLHALGPMREMLDQTEREAVRMLREVGVPWAEIGRALGVTGQAVSKRYSG